MYDKENRWNGLLSKELIGTKSCVKTIIIVTKKNDNVLKELTREVADWLLHHHLHKKDKYTMYLPPPSESCATNRCSYVDQDFRADKCFDFPRLLKDNPSNENHLKFWTPQICSQEPNLFDFVITLGGDGTVLYTSWLFQNLVPPVVSFSLGSLGFLTPFDFSDFRTTLQHSLDSEVTACFRRRFECVVKRAVAGGDTESSVESEGADVLQRHPHIKGVQRQRVSGVSSSSGAQRERGGQNSLNHYTDEYWKSDNRQKARKADGVNEEEDLNTRHTATECFVVLNELVVVHPFWFLILIL